MEASGSKHGVASWGGMELHFQTFRWIDSIQEKRILAIT